MRYSIAANSLYRLTTAWRRFAANKAAVIAGETEMSQGVWKVKDLTKREESMVSEAELVETVRKAVTGSGTV